MTVKRSGRKDRLVHLCTELAKHAAAIGEHGLSKEYDGGVTLGQAFEVAFGELVGLHDFMIEGKELSGERTHEARIRFRKELEEAGLRGEDMPGRCPVCREPEVPASDPRTVYACGSSDYDQRPDTFERKCEVKARASV